MDASSLQYRLTDDERRTFNETGVLQIDNALSPEQVAALTDAADKIYAGKVDAGHNPSTALFYPNFIPDSPLFADLVDYPKILPKYGVSSAGISTCIMPTSSSRRRRGSRGMTARSAGIRTVGA